MVNGIHGVRMSWHTVCVYYQPTDHFMYALTKRRHGQAMSSKMLERDTVCISRTEEPIKFQV